MFYGAMNVFHIHYYLVLGTFYLHSLYLYTATMEGKNTLC